MYAVTGASGQLGRLVIEELLGRVAPERIVALVRDPARVADFAERGVIVRAFDYADPATLAPALQGVQRLLLISSSEVGQREAQHQAVVDAAKAAAVSAIAYTSILRADTNPFGLAVEHRATEAAIKASGLRYALLRNGWYTENYTMNARPAVEHGAVIGSTGEGRISAAARADYAAAAAAVLVNVDIVDQVYELAGDQSFTLGEYAAALAAASGKPVAYVHMSEQVFRETLEGMGLPSPLAAMLADSSAKAADGPLFDDSHTLSGLIGRPTTPLADVVAKALA
ncbi:NAD(P)H-binding protein [Sphingomonas sp. AP4-R1]|uniref:NAD(P)H-binding protein n=1 Tax=Sphingomonas sp. AP4-R1 TaxID=2735134 RepID=UPI00149334C8|nr:NAD(P)H-binding protein [Sphingomonas sp. AP4-R1]QJU58983.1 NAD(P)H-binding protein [Sphingomonas sp. AP4-R1]